MEQSQVEDAPDYEGVNAVNDPLAAIREVLVMVQMSKVGWKKKALGYLQFAVSQLEISDADKGPTTRGHSRGQTNVDSSPVLNDTLYTLLDEVRDLKTSLNARLDGVVAETKANKQAVAAQQESIRSYASVAREAAAKPSPRAQSARSYEVVVSLADMTEDERAKLLDKSPALLKKRVEDILEKGPTEEIRSVRILGVWKSSKSQQLVVKAVTEEEANTLKHYRDNWIPAAFPNTKPHRPPCPLLVHHVPTSFIPNSDRALQQICAENPHLGIVQTNILSVRWLRDPGTETKRKSSIVLTINDGALADIIIDYGICINGVACTAEKLVKTSVQCFHCQKHGHISKTCPDILKPPTCARCAGPHRTSSGECERDCGETKCADIRRCPHFRLKCANCDGNHRSIDKSCVARQKAMFFARRHDPSPYFECSGAPTPPRL